MRQDFANQNVDEGCSEVQKILHEINDEPGPSFSCYCVKEDCEAGCIRCEIHCNGRRKPPIRITLEQLEKYRHVQEGRTQLKAFLKREIDNLLSDEEEFIPVLAEENPFRL